MKIGVGGAILELPDAATDADIQAAIKDFRTTPEFDSLIDKKSGAPARVRALVGASPEPDRLPTLQSMYPDAQPYKDDNFVFTDPGTGKLTLYNPIGMDLGDVASVGREVVQTGASIFGAVGGFAVGGPAGAVAGAGAGNVAGAATVDMVTGQAGRVATRGTGDVAKDIAIDFAVGAIGQKVGDLFSLGAKYIFGGNGGKAIVEAFNSLNIKAPAGAASGSKAVGTLEHALENSPASSAQMQRQAETVIAQTKAAADKIAQSYGPTLTKQGAGNKIKEAAANTAARFDANQAKAYDEAFDLVGTDTPTAVNSITALREEMESELSRAPSSLGKVLKPAISQLKAMEDDAAANGGGIAFDAFREIRTMVGRDIIPEYQPGGGSAANAAQKRIYGALTEDMSAAAKAAGPDAAKKLAAADRYTRIYMNEVAKTMEKIARFDADEKAFEFAMVSAKDGGSALSKLRRNFEPEEWDAVAGTVLGRMGLARAGVQDATQEAFSPNTFLTNWSKLSPEAKTALFGGKRYETLAPELDKLVKVIGSIKEMEKLTNTSNTARNLIAYSTMTTLGAALGGFAGGDIPSAAGGVAATILAPRAAAKLITSPAFVRWLTTPVTNPNGIGPHMSRLVAIGEAQPEIKEEIDQYIKALRSIPAPANKAPVKTGAIQPGEDWGSEPLQPPSAYAMTLTQETADESAASAIR